MEIRIERPQYKEQEYIHDVFKSTIEKAFDDNGIAEKSDLKREISNQMRALESDFESNGKENHFLVAKVDGAVVGTAAYGPVNSDITDNLAVPKGAVEVKSVYVHPEFQGQGIGKLLFHGIVSQLANLEIQDFYLDCGYRVSQEFWENELGDATYCVKNKWGAGAHYKIWKVALKESCLLKK